MIEAENLTRNYGSVTAVDNVSFSIGDGEIVGLLGHNGAGKTTIMKMLTGFLEPSAGRVSINGHDIESDRAAAQSLIGYLPENCPLYPEMTVAAFLDYAAGLKGLPDEVKAGAIREAIAATELQDKIMSPISSLSRGYRQRVGVAQAILHNPKIVILDEPTNGLDPSQIKQMRGLIKRLALTATVIISTHILQEVAAICGRVIIINRGKLALDKPLGELGGGSRLRLVTNGKPGQVKDILKPLQEVRGIETIPAGDKASTYALSLDGGAGDEAAAQVARAITGGGLSLYALHTEIRDLETVFAEITQGAQAQEVAYA
jgi:ABC-2 type transport system ATP-binding protein